MPDLSNTLLYIVPTPIGNLEDITLRAIRILKNVDLILAEDTRNSKILLQKYDIETPMQSYHMHNEHAQTMRWVQYLQQGRTLAIISDGGTPGISDPGYLLINQCIENNIPFECLPGPTAFVPALLQSGFPNHIFLFAGFLPAKKGRQSLLQALAKEKKTIVLYESPHKIQKLLEQVVEFFSPLTPVSLSRELTKLHEETLRGSAQELLVKIQEKKLKGEMVVIINNQ